MDFRDWLLGLPPRLIAYSLWVLMWWLLISKFGYREKLRLYWLIPFLVPPVQPYLIKVPGFAFIALLLLPWPVWKEVRRARQLIENRPTVKTTALKPGQIYYIKLPGDRWIEAKYSHPSIVKGQTRYCFTCNGGTVAVDPEKTRTAF